jgi:hypothetical protein
MKSFFEYQIEDTFELSGLGLVIIVNATNGYPPGTKVDVSVMDSDGKEVLQDTATQEWVRKLRDEGSVESITFVMSTAKKDQVPLNGRIAINVISEI